MTQRLRSTLADAKSSRSMEREREELNFLARVHMTDARLGILLIVLAIPFLSQVLISDQQVRK